MEKQINKKDDIKNRKREKAKTREGESEIKITK